MSDKHTWPCPGKPEDLLGQPIGMYHCEYCGEMQVAGLAHLPPQFPSQWEEPFPKMPEPELPPLRSLVEWIVDAADRQDLVGLRAHLEVLTQYPREEQNDAWSSFHAHRDDPDWGQLSSRILEHVDVNRDDDDNWIVSLKGET